ncbi:MAG: type VII secretion protein EssB/YukC [Culicoidibacterales bacterium]
MNESMKKIFKKSQLGASTEYERYQLERKSEYLLDCKITKNNDEYEFEFQKTYEEEFSSIHNLGILNKYQILMNVIKLLPDVKKLNISLDPSNLLIDTNLTVKAIMRDIYSDTEYSEIDFLNKYRALIGYSLQDKYSYNDYYSGGIQLLQKHPLTRKYLDVETLLELNEILHQEYNEAKQKSAQTIIEVDKNKYKKIQSYTKWITIISLLMGIFLLYFGVFRLNEEKTFNLANEAFIKLDYLTVNSELSKIQINRMNFNTKYIITVSTIKSEALSEEQKNNILAVIGSNTDERILDYWVYLSKYQVSEAIDVAKQLGNLEYQAYAYMKEKAMVEADSTLNGQEREEKLHEITQNIDTLGIDELINE